MPTALTKATGAPDSSKSRCGRSRLPKVTESAPPAPSSYSRIDVAAAPGLWRQSKPSAENAWPIACEAGSAKGERWYRQCQPRAPSHKTGSSPPPHVFVVTSEYGPRQPLSLRNMLMAPSLKTT